jgi:MFS family permease
MALAAVGLAAGALVPVPVVFALGLVASGVGSSGIFPLAFSAASRTPGVPPGVGAATVSLAARLGFLVEPLVMGFVADAVSLRWAYGMVAATALVIALCARRILRTDLRDDPPVDGAGPARTGRARATGGPDVPPRSDNAALTPRRGAVVAPRWDTDDTPRPRPPPEP